jgi:hypothetical protein
MTLCYIPMNNKMPVRLPHKKSRRIFSLQNEYFINFLIKSFVILDSLFEHSWSNNIFLMLIHSSSSSLTRQPYVDRGLPQKLLPAKVIRLLLLQISWQECFPGWGCQPHAQPPAIPEGVMLIYYWTLRLHGYTLQLSSTPQTSHGTMLSCAPRTNLPFYIH